ncbi:hypothetical protein HZU77_005215 [Neisseriaceae bacterium TC5R-5]|nr:hypothetical protein [Neisseriaceae bacterium TC5R-5]
MVKGWLLLALCLVASLVQAAALSASQQQLLQGVLLRGCLKRSPADNGFVTEPSAQQLEQFCDCASQHLAPTFSSEEVMGVLTGQIKKDDPRGRQRLKAASTACAQFLE